MNKKPEVNQTNSELKECLIRSAELIGIVKRRNWQVTYESNDKIVAVGSVTGILMADTVMPSIDITLTVWKHFFVDYSVHNARNYTIQESCILRCCDKITKYGGLAKHFDTNEIDGF
jgi:hypothetical protein